MAQSLSFLLSSEAAVQRATRSTASFVVHAETVSGLDRETERFVEIDADDVDHAHNLARHWVDVFGAVSAAVRRRDPDGTLHKPCWIASEVFDDTL